LELNYEDSGNILTHILTPMALAQCPELNKTNLIDGNCSKKYIGKIIAASGMDFM